MNYEPQGSEWLDLNPGEIAIEVKAIEADMEGDRAMDYDPDRNRFRKYDQEFGGPMGRVVLTGSVPIWRCKCGHSNHEVVVKCNNCGLPKPVKEETAA